MDNIISALRELHCGLVPTSRSLVDIQEVFEFVVKLKFPHYILDQQYKNGELNEILDDI